MLKKKNLLWLAFAILALIFTLIQFVPSAPVLIPAELPPEQRAAHRLLNFEGVDNFRDLGGYEAAGGRKVKWGTLYRSANFAETSRSDQQVLDRLNLYALVDFRSAAEKAEEPNQLPEKPAYRLVEIPTMDGGNNSVHEEIIARFEDGNFSEFDPDVFMIAANRAFATTFTPQFREFIGVIREARGRPVVWHCSAGKDRTGFAAAILLRILGVPDDVIMADYLLSRDSALAARQKELTLLRLMEGDEAADKLAILLGVEAPWLEAAFETIDQQYGNFDTYVREALGLDDTAIGQLRAQLLE
ncbi:tyrosine-protein phosphatase [Seongchinamella unica]|uniref:tyrosine-protein phosphatase n=1 Tax=Seongchinamella unica TaxID=2547392 RepID=UPI001404EC10|nr:tyrosine-protein phosphatase [Seongchinamella unica]